MANYYSSCGWLPFGLGKIRAEGVGTCGTSTELNDGTCQLVEGVGTCGTTTELNDGTCQLVEGAGTCGALTELKDGTCQPIELLRFGVCSLENAVPDYVHLCHMHHQPHPARVRVCPWGQRCFLMDYLETGLFTENETTLRVAWVTPDTFGGTCPTHLNAFVDNSAWHYEFMREVQHRGDNACMYKGHSSMHWHSIAPVSIQEGRQTRR